MTSLSRHKTALCVMALAPAMLLAGNVLGDRVYTGLEMFMAKHKKLVKGKRVGLVTNQTGVDAAGRSTIDLFHADPDIKLVALFAPEHGIRGDIKAGQNFKGGKDPRTGLPIYTLYGGADHLPPKAGLDKVDVLVYDIQDVGSRAYTFVWHMAECMRACAMAGKTFIVLDRPNPYGPGVMDGPVAEKKYLSFIGLYPVPRVYGLTVGELASYLNREERINATLVVVPMGNYRRGTPWAKTGLRWTAPSPNIPSPESAMCFAATGTLGETGMVDTGCGTKMAFRTVTACWIKAKFSADELNKYQLPGVRFQPYLVRDAKAGRNYNGVEIVVTDPVQFRPSLTEVAILAHLRKFYPAKFTWAADGDRKRLATFDKASGTASVRKMIEGRGSPARIAAAWEPGLAAFKARSKPYRIYK